MALAALAARAVDVLVVLPRSTLAMPRARWRSPAASRVDYYIPILISKFIVQYKILCHVLPGNMLIMEVATAVEYKSYHDKLQ